MAETGRRPGAGPLRVHDGGAAGPLSTAFGGHWHAQPAGIDLPPGSRLDPSPLPVRRRRQVPWRSSTRAAAVAVRAAAGRCTGSSSPPGRRGARHRAPRGIGRRRRAGHRGPDRRAGGRGRSRTERLVLARGRLPDAARLGLTPPVLSSSTTRSRSRTRSARSRADAPFLIWDDGQTLPWSSGGARRASRRIPSSAVMLEPFPPGVHTAPGGREPGEPDAARALGPRLGGGRGRRSRRPPYVHQLCDPRMARMVPGFAGYSRPDAARLRRRRLLREDPREPAADRALAGRGRRALPSCWHSGFGIMAGCAGGELVAAHVTGSTLPGYAPAFTLARATTTRRTSLPSRPAATGQI